GFDHDKKCDEGEQHRIDECGEDPGAVVTVGFLVCRRARGPARGEPGDDERGNVGEIVSRVADQRDGMRGIAGDDLDRDERKRGGDGGASTTRHALADGEMRVAVSTVVVRAIVRMGMRMHSRGFYKESG